MEFFWETSTMPLTHHATKLVLGLVLLCGSALSAAKQLVLDLTTVPAAERRSLGVPGSSVSNFPKGGTAGEFYRLPIRLQLNKLTELDGGTKIRIELSLLNQSGSPVSIPSCADAEKAHSAGAGGRRTLNFGLVFKGTKKDTDQIVDVTFGSASRPQCWVVLGPQDTLLVIDEIYIPRGIVNQDISSITAFLEEWKIEDARYFIQAHSQRVESQPVDASNRNSTAP
jgi:hypothetical protein